MVEVPIQNGKWDAAFKATGKENLGFDFKNSPFGKDSFDVWYQKTDYTYSDIFTGFVFYLPLEKHSLQNGVKNFLLGMDMETIVNEWNLFNHAVGKTDEMKYTPEFGEKLKEQMETETSGNYGDSARYEATINQWLKK
jgi:hypothetical protein